MRFVALVVAALIATAHAQVTIEYWHINSATFGAQAVTQAVAAFEAEHPDIRVIERFQEGSYGGLLTNLQAAIAAGRPPAVAQIGYNFRLFAFNELPHVPIDTFSDRDDYAAFIDAFIPGMLRLGTDEAGVLRAVPFAVSVPMLYYNADLFREAGLDPDAPPATWAEVREAAKTIREATGRFGIGIQISNSNNWVPQGLIESNGGEILDAEGRIAVDGPEVVEVYEFWQALALEDGTLPVVTDAEQEQAFLAGQLGMYIRTSASLANYTAQSNFDMRTAMFPTWGDKPRSIPSGGNALFVFASDPAEQQAAFEFMSFLVSREGQTIWVRDTGYLPVADGVADDPAFLADFFAENPLIAPAVEQLPDAVAWLPLPGERGFEAEQALIGAREAILNGAPVAETLTRTAAQMRELLGQ
ncbi:MAG: ABC transporter substrate-binding protein [Trueperaceae bacterium]|nr:ABC transporter substrate-binding protein [Trueperaceae bacterium]